VPCFSPLSAWQHASGEIVFVERGDITRALFLPCGRCVGCLSKRCRDWSVRCTHEAQMHDLNCVITLTYDDEHLPWHSSLSYPDFQNFMKRLRKRLGVPVSFFCSGEYGDKSDRPHYHACLFGIDFLDKLPWKKTEAGSSLFSSKMLDSLWPFGQALVGEMTPQSAAYVAGYVHKKRTGHRSQEWYRRVDKGTGEIYYLEPEFSQPSLRPAIGLRWLDKFGKSDVFNFDSVVLDGKEVFPPAYYDKVLKRRDALALDDAKVRRELEASFRKADNTPERLAAKEAVLRARLSLSKRSLK